MNVRFIAEIGSNWEGQIELAKEHILKSKASGANYVKFQMWRAEDLYSRDHPQWESIKKAQLSFDVARELKSYSDKIGIAWFCSVFYPEAVDFLEELDISNYKIASRTSTFNDKFSLETIKKVGQSKKNTFVSIGEGGDRNKIASYFEPEKCNFTYCVSSYPTKDEEIEWDELLKNNFFSDHTLGITIPVVYSILKRQQNVDEVFIEKHVKLPQNKGPDSDFAITYDELKNVITHAKRISKLNLNN
jgi:N,N'-diacetyllegionaminate synthase